LPTKKSPIMKECGELCIFWPGYSIKIWNAKGNYANRFGIGPDVIQVLMSFPPIREFN